MAPANTPTRSPDARTRSGTRAALSPVAWTAKQELDFRAWEAEGQRISAITRGNLWWIGDWLIYCAATWGERYTEARRITGMKPKSLRNIRWVAASVEAARRREKLSYSHHELVAGLEHGEQEHWLDRAETDRLTVEDLRIELRAAKRSGHCSKLVTSSRNVTSVVVTCPNCGGEIPIPVPGKVPAQMLPASATNQSAPRMPSAS